MSPEALEQSRIKKIVTQLRGVVWETSDHRGRRAGPDAGLPDLIIFLNPKRLMVWWEVKAPKGRASEAQLEFQKHCDRCNQYMGIGTCDDFKNFLKQFGYGFL